MLTQLDYTRWNYSALNRFLVSCTALLLVANTKKKGTFINSDSSCVWSDAINQYLEEVFRPLPHSSFHPRCKADHQSCILPDALGNDQARVYYEQHRTWKSSYKRLVSPTKIPFPSVSGSIKLDRDEQSTRQRYLRMGKEALVERLLAIERTFAEQRERWLMRQDEVLTWRLRAEAAKARLKKV